MPSVSHCDVTDNFSEILFDVLVTPGHFKSLVNKNLRKNLQILFQMSTVKMK